MNRGGGADPVTLRYAVNHLIQRELPSLKPSRVSQTGLLAGLATSDRRIVIIQPWIRLGGAELVSLHLAHELKRLGRQAVIVCSFVDLKGLPGWAEDLQYSLPPRWLAEGMQRSRILFLLLSPWVLLALVWKHSRNAWILNPHNFPATWVASAIARLRRIPAVWFCNEPPTRLSLRDAWRVGLPDFMGWLVASSWLDKLLVKRIADVCVPSTMTRLQVERRYQRPARVLHVGVDSEYFRADDGSDPRLEFNLLGKFVLLCVGKLHPQKNQIVCLEALREVVGQIPEAVLVLAGDGPSAVGLKSAAAQWDLREHVRFLGSVDSMTARRLYQACDVNLIPAINQSWGFTAFEALCTGKVSVVSMSAGGAAEILSENRIGVVCEPNGHAFAQAILGLYRDRAEYERLSNSGEEHVLRELTWHAFAKRTLEVFDEQVR